jgi:GT2 family glycosyltransferase
MNDRSVADAMAMSRPKAVLAILTRDRPEMLRRCLASVAALNAPTDLDLDVVVIDNGSAPPALERNRRTVEEGIGPFAAALVVEPEPGIPAARNRALAEADVRHAVAVIFLDDDQSVPADWLVTLLTAWREENVDIVKPLVRWAFDPPGRLTQHFRARDPDGPARSPATYHIATNGVLVGRRVWTELGVWFDLRLAHSGGEDSRFFRDALNRGASAIITRETQAIEHCPAEKQTRRWLLRRAWRVGAVEASTRLKGGGPMRYVARGVLGMLAEGILALFFLWSPERAFAHLLRGAKAMGRLAGSFGGRIDEYDQVIGR